MGMLKNWSKIDLASITNSPFRHYRADLPPICRDCLQYSSKYLNNPVTDITISSDADKKAIVNKHIKELYIERVGSATKIVVNGISYLYNPRKNKKPTLL